MRILAVRPGPNFSVQDVHRGWVNGLREAGATVVDAPFDSYLTVADKLVPVDLEEPERSRAMVQLACHSLRADVYDVWPDLILITSGFHTPPDLIDVMRTRGHKVCLLATESPYMDDKQVQLAEHCDYAIVNDPTNLHRYRGVTNAWYFPHAYDPTIHHKVPYEQACASDFCFVGSCYPERIRFFETVERNGWFDGLDVAFAGYWDRLDNDSRLLKFLAHDREVCCENTDTVRLYSSTKVSANVYRQEAERPELSEGWSMGPREVELAATGCFYLTESRGENREVLPMIPTFVGPDDFGEQLHYWLKRPKAREQVAERARDAIAPRTFANNAQRLLGLVAP